MPDERDNNKPGPEAALLALRPLHCVSVPAALHIRRRTGRPRQVKPAPDVDGRAYAEEVGRIAGDFIAQDELVQAAAVERERDDPTVLDEAMLQLAREQASLHFDRVRMMKDGKDIGQVASRRVEALSRLSAICAEKARLGVDDGFDPRAEKFQRVVQMFFATFADAAREVMDATTAERFICDVLARVQGWEDRVQ